MNKLIFIATLALSFTSFADTIKAVGYSDRSLQTYGLEQEAIEDAKNQIHYLCERDEEYQNCENIYFEIQNTKTITTGPCDTFEPGRPMQNCKMAIAEVWGFVH